MPINAQEMNLSKRPNTRLSDDGKSAKVASAPTVGRAREIPESFMAGRCGSNLFLSVVVNRIAHYDGYTEAGSDA
ncbi:hypothetical protein DO65_6236 [Burkholderia pseudomallei]|nr:hypothetical protein DO65_6236 [Burkholderia pseudomallei]